jgi:hypothetical protein
LRDLLKLILRAQYLKMVESYFFFFLLTCWAYSFSVLTWRL